MRSCSCTANKVIGLAEGQKRRTWWEEREATKQEEIEGWVSTEVSQRGNFPMADRKVADMQGLQQEIMCRVVSGLCPQQGQWSLSHSPCFGIICPTAECSLTDLDIQRRYIGGEAEDVWPMADQLTKGKAAVGSR